ncbi:MAG: adenylyl-sulfate kinase [Marinilabiliales bacterium]|nr:MAG: adenylyl-sulfate kinase [Marinilabiliales bacterium]
MSENNIYPVFDRIKTREDKEKLLQQKSKVIWITGLSGSGKTTIATGLEDILSKNGFVTQVLDGDNIRTGISNNLAFTEEDRKENIRRIAEVSKLFLNCGIITINCLISPTIESRQMAKEIIGDDNFILIWVNTPLAICEERDVKGLYKKARAGIIKNFTGIDQAYIEPENPDLTISTEKDTPEEATEILAKYVIPLITYTEK